MVPLRLLCPSCETYVVVDEALQSTRCSQCEQWLHAIDCTSCGRSFVATGARTSRCPRCGHVVHFAGARLRTFREVRDPETGDVSVAERPAPTARHAREESWDRRAATRFLARFFTALTWLVVIDGIATMMYVDDHLSRFPRSSGVVLLASIEILSATAVLAALFAFCSHTLSLLLELVERPDGATRGERLVEGIAAREPGD